MSSAAQDAPAAEAAAPAAPAAKWSDKVTVEGYADTYFSYRIGGDEKGGQPAGTRGAPSEFRIFDAENETFQLAYAELAVAMKPEPAGFRLDVGFGNVADLTAPHGVVFDSTTGALVDATTHEIWKHVQQAYASFQMPGLKMLTVDFGRFVTSAGAEVIEAGKNWNYSRSYLFGWAIPFTHTGLRATAAVSDTFTLQASLVNGWEVVNDNNKAKTFGIGASFAAPFGTTFAANVYAGPEGQASDKWRILADVIVAHTVGGLGLNLNFDYGQEATVDSATGNDETGSWYGVALMANYQVMEMLRLALRGEYFADPNNMRFNLGGAGWVEKDGLAVAEVTLTAGVPIGSNVEIRAELRHDLVVGGKAGGQDIKPFLSGTTDPQDAQTTVQLAAMAWF
jgi:hypothetical protein